MTLAATGSTSCGLIVTAALVPLWPFGSFMDYAIEGAARTVGRTRAAGRRLRRPLIR